MFGKTRHMIETGALLATIMFVTCAPVIAAKATQDPLQGDALLRPGVVEGVETPLAVALRVVGSLRSPFRTTEMRSPS